MLTLKQTVVLHYLDEFIETMKQKEAQYQSFKRCTTVLEKYASRTEAHTSVDYLENMMAQI